ncbi:methyltransferase, FxLD system [Yinghuangia sp. ASG 101]|uniref:methyltransferase, FxLD system n=1 Tax=Yinghuangia sp. ASG 101 TaxID=2896848 RepID=UPI001E5F274F|nr:methyltransferase, FxLD system [Yinghuangia sp. ASG 101]UGQ10487.1 methyltransferase, FxLD system [Yinghuangia sp. ASG 101]
MTLDPRSAEHACAADRLRNELVEHLKASGAVRTLEVEQALRTVARHVFVPDATLEEAYADDVVAAKRDEDGRLTSSASQPGIVAAMLERAAVRPGQAVLEIGTATGYNAALLAELGAQVTSVEYDADLVATAEQALKATGYGAVSVVAGDGEFGVPDAALFDTVIVTVQAADIPAAWFDQLRVGGRLVVPLRMRGLPRVVTFVRELHRFSSEAIDPGGFVAMQGAGAWAQTVVELGDGLRLYVDEDQPVDAAALAAARGDTTVWSGVVLRSGERALPLLDLFLATTVPACGRMAAPDALPGSSAATWGPGGYAYTVIRPAVDGHEVGVRIVGGTVHAEVFAAAIRLWDREYRGGPPPVLCAYPHAGAPDGPGVPVDKRHVRIVADW